MYTYILLGILAYQLQLPRSPCISNVCAEYKKGLAEKILFLFPA